jgi:hypothetical protein
MSPPKPSTGAKVKDPIDTLYRWLTNAPDYDEGPAKSLKVAPSNPFNSVPELDMSKLDTKGLGARLEDLMQSPVMQGMARMAVQTADNNPQSRGFMSGNDAMIRAQQQSTVTNNNVTNNNNTTNAPVMNMTVNATTNADPHEIVRHAKEVFSDELNTLLNTTLVGIGSDSQ